MSTYFKRTQLPLTSGSPCANVSPYPKSFKTQIVQEGEQSGVSVAAIAMRHGINANVVHRWIPLYRDQQAVTLPAFIPLKVEPKRKTEVVAMNYRLGSKCSR